MKGGKRDPDGPRDDDKQRGKKFKQSNTFTFAFGFCHRVLLFHDAIVFLLLK